MTTSTDSTFDQEESMTPKQQTEFRLTDPDLMECPYPHYAAAFAAGERVVTDPDIGVVVLESGAVLH